MMTACADGAVTLWKGAKRSIEFKGHTEAVRALVRIDEQLFASASNDMTIRLWNFLGDAITVLEGHAAFIYTMIILPNLSTQRPSTPDLLDSDDEEGGGHLVSAGEDGEVLLWDGASLPYCILVIG